MAAIVGTYRRNNLMRGLVVGVGLLVFWIWCVYDGWFNEEYRKPEKASSLQFSQAMGWVCPVLLLGLGAYSWRLSLRTLVLDEDGIREGSQSLRWAQVTRVDDSRLEEWLLKLEYLEEPTDAEPTVWALDGYEYTRFEDMVDFVQAHVPPAALAGMKTPVEPKAQTGSTPDAG